MAPSRALLRLHRSPVHLRASPRFLSTSCRIRSQQPTIRPVLPAVYSGSSQSCSAILYPISRAYSTTIATPPEPPDYLNERELHIFNKVKVALEPVKLEVQDISGGCGSMYSLEIQSARFKGLTIMKQHKMVNEVLKEEIKGWHGVQLRTKAA